MSERIKELYIQARDAVSMRDGMITPGNLRDKFAELIVKDCLWMCDTAAWGHTTHGDDKEAAGALSVQNYILDHFEIED